MKIAIIGTGGVGGYFGAKLAKAGFDITFLARGKHLQTIKKSGLKIKSISGDFHVENPNASDNIRDIGLSDLIILAVKAWQIKEIRSDLKSIMHKNTIILPLQNGVVTADELAEEIDRSNILGGLARIFSQIEEPGVISHFGVTPTIVFGEFNKTVSKRTQKIKEIFDRANFNSQISKDIEADLWKKFISICDSGLLAITRATYGEVRELKETRQLMTNLLYEIYELSQKIGIHIEPDFVEKSISFRDTFPYDATSSLTRDVWGGKPSEIEYQNGTVVRLGEKYGVDTPVNRFVYYCILPMEKKVRKQKN